MSTTDPSPDRSRPRWLLPAVALGAVLLAGVLALTQPWLLWVDEVASEQLPAISSGEVEEGSAATEDPDASSGSDMAEQDAAVEEASEENAPSSSPADPSPSSQPAAPVVLASGSFISRDHATSGEAAIVQLADGSRVLTIDGLQTDNGPDLYVYLDDGPADGPEDGFDDGIDLGALRGNIGDLVYEIPDDVDLDDVASVGIWCDRFSSLFGAADLT